METLIVNNLQKLTPRISFQIVLVLLILASLAIGQTGSLKDCPDSKKNKNQTAEKRKNQNKNQANFNKFNWTDTKTNPFERKRINRNPVSIERSIAVNSKSVFVQLCVSEGKVKINGWNRSEVRAFIKDGENLGIKVREVSKTDKKPVWIDVVGYNADKNYDARNSGERAFNNCLSGETIELDVPHFADVKIEGRSGRTTVDEVKTAKINVIDGDISVNNVSDSTEAQTHQGNIIVRNSGGKMLVSTTTGNIIAYNTESSEIGDYFKAKTRSGAVTLQSIGQKEVEASSVSGSLNYVGNILNFGKYGFSTTNGFINLIVPATSSFRLTVAYGGAFQSELPVSNIMKTRTDSIMLLTGRIGEGEANVTLKSFNGTIRVRKQDVKLAQLFR